MERTLYKARSDRRTTTTGKRIGWKLAPMAENHTGTGITRQDIQAQALPLPAQDFIPRTIEEQILAFADKFYSKGRDLTREKSLGE